MSALVEVYSSSSRCSYVYTPSKFSIYVPNPNPNRLRGVSHQNTKTIEARMVATKGPSTSQKVEPSTGTQLPSRSQSSSRRFPPTKETPFLLRIICSRIGWDFPLPTTPSHRRSHSYAVKKVDKKSPPLTQQITCSHFDWTDARPMDFPRDHWHIY